SGSTSPRLEDRGGGRNEECGDRNRKSIVLPTQGGEKAHRGENQIPFGHQQHRQQRVRPGLIQTLKRSGPPCAVIDPANLAQRSDQALTIDPAAPTEMSGSVVLFRPLLCEQRLRAPIPLLLSPIRSDRVAAVMPDRGRGAEAQGSTLCLQAPAKIYIVTRHAKLRIEPMDGHDRCPSKGH